MKALSLRDVSFSYNGHSILRGISFDVEKGEFLVILGPNGAGKSTLLRCIMGMLKCSGSIEIMGRNLAALRRDELAKLISYVPQRVEPNFLRVFDFVLLGRKPYMGLRPSNDDIKSVMHALKTVGIEKLAERPTRMLSGGELQKAAIARALAQETPIILLDEPTNNLDPKSQIEVMNVLKRLSKEGKTVISVMHDVNLALRYGDRMVFIKEGKFLGECEAGNGCRELLKAAFDSNVEIVETKHGFKICYFF
ncbi:iron ABC transporter ATP-binding protein [Thermococcus chitonophagus]|uniref:Ferrichrome transport ATP-binding protein n=1 Tax=Thermococcus chitonophagus TaxID=54262 RepID=A0A160VRP7_9EURY|nr:ABC transporter ATP-binding protein [Thermococcus chitonophagus]ASJ16588.1 iron ABC transporter ATP-binding protein [Thermococcus chitonophagus]CUX77492.1 ferrichrome transport ATP-binding protein [Thermococcus chitonophagus]